MSTVRDDLNALFALRNEFDNIEHNEQLIKKQEQEKDALYKRCESYNMPPEPKLEIDEFALNRRRNYLFSKYSVFEKLFGVVVSICPFIIALLSSGLFSSSEIDDKNYWMGMAILSSWFFLGVCIYCIKNSEELEDHLVLTIISSLLTIISQIAVGVIVFSEYKGLAITCFVFGVIYIYLGSMFVASILNVNKYYKEVDKYKREQEAKYQTAMIEYKNKKTKAAWQNRQNNLHNFNAIQEEIERLENEIRQSKYRIATNNVLADKDKSKYTVEFIIDKIQSRRANSVTEALHLLDRDRKLPPLDPIPLFNFDDIYGGKTRNEYIAEVYENIERNKREQEALDTLKSINDKLNNY